MHASCLDRSKSQSGRSPLNGLVVFTVIFAGADFQKALADGPRDAGDREAKAIALRVHAETAAIDKLPRFDYRVQAGNGDVETMLDREECSLPGLKKALDEPISRQRWFECGQTLAWSNDQALWSTFGRKYKNDRQESTGDTFRQDRVWTIAEAFERGAEDGRTARFVLVEKPEHVWQGRLTELAWFRVTPHRFWWGTNDHHNDTISTIPPERSSYRFAAAEKFDDELCDVVESATRPERLWIGRESGRLRGVLVSMLRGPLPDEPFYKTELVEKMAGRPIVTQEEYRDWVEGLTAGQKIELSILWNETYSGLFGPNELIRFRDYREVSPGVWIPFREDRAFTHPTGDAGGGGRRHKYIHLWVTVQEVRTDIDLTDTIEKLRPRDGDQVQDQRFGAAIDYPFRRRRSERELLDLAAHAVEESGRNARPGQTVGARRDEASVQRDFASAMIVLDSIASGDQMEMSLRQKIALIDSLCGLTVEQKQKLELAGRGDLKRYSDRAAEIKTQFRLAGNDPEKLAELRREALAVTCDFLALSNDDRLFIGVLEKLLTPDQASRFQSLRDVFRAGGQARMDESESGAVLAIMLNATAITDDGLVSLKKLPNLQFLNVSGTQMSDAGLEHLRGITSLERLVLSKTKVTDAGIDDLKKALPELTVEK